MTSQSETKLGVGHASVTDLEKEYVLDALDSQRLSQGRYVAEFERRFASMHGHRYGVMCNSGTSALHIALEALKETDGWGSDTEILVPAITFIATSNAVLHAGLKPVFVDVDPTTYNIDPAQIEQHISKNTRCVIPVHCFGMPADMDAIGLIAQKNDLRIIEDCAESHFARINGSTVGSFSDIMASSTYVAHTITTGIGGISCTSDPRLAEIMRSLVAHGRSCTCERCIASDGKSVCPKRMDTDIDRRFRFERLGYSYRVGEIEGALGLAQLQRAEEIMALRKRNALLLINRLQPYRPVLQLPEAPDNIEHTYMMFPLLIKDESISRDDFAAFLESHNIETRPMLPLLNQPVYRELFGNIERGYPAAKAIAQQGLYIGCHHGLDEDDMERIADRIIEFLEGR